MSQHCYLLEKCFQDVNSLDVKQHKHVQCRVKRLLHFLLTKKMSDRHELQTGGP